MSIAIALSDVLAAGLFLAAAVVAVMLSRLRGGRTRLWAFAAIAFVTLSVERSLNALEWGLPGAFGWLDTFQGYLSALAHLVLLTTALDFSLLLRRAHGRGAAGQ